VVNADNNFHESSWKTGHRRDGLRYKIYDRYEKKARFVDFQQQYRYIICPDFLFTISELKEGCMAQHKSAEKRARVEARRATRNGHSRSRMRTAVKQIRTSTDKAKAAEDLKKATKLLDKLAAKGIIHKNKAANLKSRLTKLVNNLK
jgi:small subunit ribosomal protein S20